MRLPSFLAPRLSPLAPLVAVIFGLLLAIPAPTSAAPAKSDQELVDKVKTTIDKGVKYFIARQTPQGNWEGLLLKYVAAMDGGTTALVTLALLNCGKKADDPTISRALVYLRTLPPSKTYVVGLQTMVFAEARQAKDLPLIQRNADWLISQAIGLRDGQLQGWNYGDMKIPPDNSNTQYAVLGLYAAKQAGAKIDDSVWKAIQEFYTRSLVLDGPKDTATSGYWFYNSSETRPSFTMTVAGVCGLIIAGMGLDQSEQNLDPASGIAARCGVYSENSATARGMNWIGAHFSFNQGKSNFYNIYGIERLGRLSGQRFIGKIDWYRDGCEHLIGKGDTPGLQKSDGSISLDSGIDGVPTITTSFALLFLSKGRTPVLISKFAWGAFKDRGSGTFAEGEEGVVNWNRKHNDTRHLVEYASRELFKGEPLSWQVYDVRRQNFQTDEDILSEVGVLLQSPLLYLNGHGKLTLTDVQVKILQKYIEEGGFIVAEACCGDREFAQSFRALMKKLFPTNDLRPLPPEHAIWQSFAPVSPADFPTLEGMERGCRTAVVFSPQPLAGYWEEAKYMPEKGKPAKNHGERAYRLAGNIIAYATGMELPKPKLTRQDLRREVETNPPRSNFKPVQLKTGESEAAPAAMRNLMSHLRTTARLGVVLEKESMDLTDANLPKYKFMYLHGRKPLNFDDQEIESLKSNLQTGGLLFADAGCNGTSRWKEFDKSFRGAMKKLFPENAMEVIPADDPLFSSKYTGGNPLTTVRCRREKPDGSGPEQEMRNYAPYLEGIKLDGRWVVIYSKYDIGCALEGHKSSDCLGHDRDSALKIGGAVVLYSLKR